MMDNTAHVSLTALTNTVDEGEIFEIFQQAPRETVPHHGGNLRAPDSELAIHYAREFYGRRQESQKLWIIPRASLLEICYDPAVPIDARPTATSEPSESFVVFVQKQAAKPLIWLQDLIVGNQQDARAQALVLLQDSAGAYLRLWLCPRSAITVLDNPDLLQPPLDRSYRRLDGYDIREKLHIARQRVRAQEERQH